MWRIPNKEENVLILYWIKTDRKNNLWWILGCPVIVAILTLMYVILATIKDYPIKPFLGIICIFFLIIITVVLLLYRAENDKIDQLLNNRAEITDSKVIWVGKKAISRYTRYKIVTASYLDDKEKKTTDFTVNNRIFKMMKADDNGYIVKFKGNQIIKNPMVFVPKSNIK